MRTCEQCSRPYEAKRATSKYCSAKCRKLAFHGTVSVPDPDQVSVPCVSVPLSVPRNPLAVPGDPDYRGVCIEVDGQWVVRADPEPNDIEHILKSSDLGSWRGSRPYYLDQDTKLSHLSCEHLHRRLSGLNQWQGSPEYAERVYRLTHGLTAHSVPANMVERASC